MTRLNIKDDAQRIFDALALGGIAIIPNDAGYAMMGGSAEAIRRIFVAKGRGEHKRNAMMCSMEMQRELHVLDARCQDMIEMITQDYNLTLGAVAAFRPEHPMLARLDPVTLAASTGKGTLGMLLNAGKLFDEVCRLSREAGLPIFGSSANLTGTGPRFRVEDIPLELIDIADVVIDYGLRKYHTYQRSATILRFGNGNVEAVRIGSCYELICDVLKRHFDVELPADPGRAANASGHLEEFAFRTA
ncbi:Sua5/YciO/YrdC/YwlC family protein [Luteibacter sp. 3190]|uniref:Sua5/YciO/YrdC/YwlC family protein n=1 Tax=Luteibacter sp. 3190 TaxID=2817736 RepID=UPI002862841E|nr:Sua5/YciO/YrdC/YwlC family protein [Luteibacter sp. 3190]MDR6935662.1 tRNA A37 threonylcarbamoyladenosine synthetase subunit TsaC/SUA5/YrdC [Luteibacter sp. 3190]